MKLTRVEGTMAAGPELIRLALSPRWYGIDFFRFVYATRGASRRQAEGSCPAQVLGFPLSARGDVAGRNTATSGGESR